jgi:hypothetical protein
MKKVFDVTKILLINNLKKKNINVYTKNIIRFYTSSHDKEGGLFQLFKSKFKESIQKEEDYQKNLEELSKSNLSKAINNVKEGIENTKKSIEPIADKISEKSEQISEKISEKVNSVSSNETVQKVKNATSEVFDKVLETKVVKIIVDDLTEESREKLEIRYTFRSEKKRKKDKKQGLYFNPYTKKMEIFDETKINTTQQGVVVSQKTDENDDLTGFRKK